jgi:hypothetical protein
MMDTKAENVFDSLDVPIGITSATFSLFILSVRLPGGFHFLDDPKQSGLLLTPSGLFRTKGEF